MRVRFSVAALTLALLAALVVPVAAQVSTGRIDAAVTDSTGAVLQGVVVEISGPQRQTAATDTAGEVHFLNLAPGTYTVLAKRASFSDYLNKNVAVATGSAVPLQIELTIAGVATQVQVTREAPIVEANRLGISTNVSVAELQNIPSSRDPWVVLQTIPGVIVDRVNVGGAESGQQSSYQAKGAGIGQNTWNMDGIAITDMSALGASPVYYDFDMFQDLRVTTGGAEITSPTPGVQLDMVLKSGTNKWRGSTRVYFENEALQANNLSPQLQSTIGGTSGKGNRIDQYRDYGGEIGGPLMKDRVWGWGALGATHIDLITLGGTHDRTELDDASAKLNAQINDALRASYTLFRADKEKFGRGAAPDRSDESTYNQSGPTTLNKGQADFTVGTTLFVAARASHTAGGFDLVPRGGAAAQVFVDDSGRIHGSNDTYGTDRPQSNLAVDANSFRGRHELKFGFGWRNASVRSSDAFPGNGIVTRHNGYPVMIARITRPYQSNTRATYQSAYAGDVWTRDRLTANLGVRWDRQAASLRESSVPASPVLPSILPALTATPSDNAIVWNALSPRVGVTYAVNGTRKTVARATYAAFASQLNATEAAIASAIQYSGIYYYALDTNGNRVADPGEIRFDLGHRGYYGFDPSNPRRAVNQIGDYATPRTHEITAGLDHELMPNFGIGGTFTYRYFNHFNWAPLSGVSSADYRQTGTLSGSASPIGEFSVPFYAINDSAIPPGGGRTYQERGGYHQRFLGFEASAVKRMSNRWMARFGFSTNSHREYFDGSSAILDPTPSPGSPNIDGGTVVTLTSGSGKSNIFMVLPKYQMIANGMFQGPYGINLAGNWVLRQGYAAPYYRSSVPTGDRLANLKNVLVVDDVARFRLPRVSSVDARVERGFRLFDAELMVDLDVFNVTNAATVLGRQYDLRFTGAVTGFNQILEVMNPRVVRLGARLTF